MILKQQFRSGFIYFLITAVLGFLLRLESTPFSIDLPTAYRFWVHTHSHIALLGWVYLGLSSLLVYFFIDKSQSLKHYLKLFWATQFCILGMLICFPIQGYALFSIIFSTLFLILSYIFFGFLLKHTQSRVRQKKSFLIIKWALLYMVLSSIGPWALGGIMVTLGNQSVWYKLSIYFYLHFQYNAWFILAAIGLLLFLLEKVNLQIEKKAFNKFFVLFNLGTIFSAFLSALWAFSHWAIYGLANLGSLCLWVGLFYFWTSVKNPLKSFYKNQSSQTKFILIFLLGVFLLKFVMQSLGGIPYFVTITAINVDLVIGYLHWFFLGFISLFLLFMASYLRWIKLSNISLGLFVSGFLLTEISIFYRAGMAVFHFPMLPSLNIHIAAYSLLLVLSIFWILVESLLAKTKYSNPLEK
ncbi:hypothetical protein [Psychroflexus tropicus]|uniref:hypothetical protein n=1 Tax=Psychroflexus tropicus TaxID=197345 RepID=UPI00037E1D3F|nr:hypothetical protein [Psychroflexus tropicus]